MCEIKKIVYAFIVIVFCSGALSVYAMAVLNNSPVLVKENRSYVGSVNLKPMTFLLGGELKLKNLKDKKEKELLEQLQNKRNFLGENNLETLVAMNNLARLYRSEEKYQDALILDEKTLNLREDLLGQNHMDTLMSMNNLAEDYRRLGKYQKALWLDKKTLDLREKILAEDKEPSKGHNIKYTLTTVKNLTKDCEALSLYETIAELKVKNDLLETKLKTEYFNDTTDKDIQDDVDIFGGELGHYIEYEEKLEEIDDFTPHFA